MDYEELLTWIQQEKPALLRCEVLTDFKTKHINGDVFLDHAYNLKFFQEGCKLPIGPSYGLVKLASEVSRKGTIGTKSKSYLSCHTRHADVQLTTSRGTANKRNCPAPPLKEVA